MKILADAHKTAAIMIECVQGEGGVVALSREYVRGIADFARENNIVLIIDCQTVRHNFTDKHVIIKYFTVKSDHTSDGVIVADNYIAADNFAQELAVAADYLTIRS